MADRTILKVWVVGCEPSRLQWLNRHILSRWPAAQVCGVPSAADHAPDAVIFLVDFANDTAAGAGLMAMGRLLRTHPGLHCIVLADNGGEASAVRALKAGAKDYLPVASITGEALLEALGTGDDTRTGQQDESPPIEVPGYGIVKPISTSNFSSVYLARSERLRRNVVLKVMRNGFSPRELEDAERFRREYEIISSISHRAIARIYDFGSVPDHQYLTMEYIPCGDLRDRLRNPMSIDDSLHYLRLIAEALRMIHACGILHRDLKPANVMLREDNSPVLIDFGLARRSLDDAGTTGAGHVLGSPFYISPEQSQGFRVDSRTDIYSLGVMFYEMLTGERPYTGRSAVAIMAQHAGAPVPRLPPPVGLQQALLDRLMAKNPADRYASADELLKDLGPPAGAAVCA